MLEIKKGKRRYVTLIEMMIVMFLIALIIGVVAYNYRGTLEEGKAFKTRVGIEKVETILNLNVSENPNNLDNIDSDWKRIIENSPLVKNPGDLIRDGWGEEYKVRVENGEIKVSSDRYEEYRKANPTK